MIEASSPRPGFMRNAFETLWNSRTTHAESWDALAIFAIRAGSAALLFLTQIALARWMGASEYGVFVAAWTCVLVVGGLCGLGFNITMMRLAPQYNASGDFASFRGLLSGGRLVLLPYPGQTLSQVDVHSPRGMTRGPGRGYAVARRFFGTGGSDGPPGSGARERS